MKQTQKDKFRSKFSSVVSMAIILGKAEESVLSLPWLQIKLGSCLFGSGESTQFGSSCLARLDGKQLERQASRYTEMDSDPARYGLGRTTLICDLGRDGKLYAVHG